ncbi:hypothetical protein FOA52_012003 [Chlamydomonas sp. UWO 241]|nr:hypothetical protein FOA52_012003 [Chlamydomonas sp. UWO 241]
MLMRTTVLIWGVLVYFPASWAAAVVFAPTPDTATMTLAALLLQPALPLIDHGHFQYNCISLGLCLAAAAAIGAGRRLIGSVLFCLALSHKQMALYFAPAFFAHLLGWALQARGIVDKIDRVVQLGATVVVTFVVVWAPVVRSSGDLLVLLQRIFPLRRGLFEDYVANFWCVTSVGPFKWQSVLGGDALVALCAGITVAAAMPAILHQIARPSKQGLLTCMANSAFAFYMFSFQVHEKSILLPLLPITALATTFPQFALWGPVVACFSMWPLLWRDGVISAYVGAIVFYLLACLPSLATQLKDLAGKAGDKAHLRLGLWTVGTMGLLHALRYLVAPPEHLPWLHDRLFVTAACFALVCAWLWLQAAQWALPADEDGDGADEGGDMGRGEEKAKRA